VEELLAERGVDVSYETVRRCVLSSDRWSRDGCGSGGPARAGGGTWTRWSFASPANRCICGVPSITKARSSTYSAHYDSLIAVPATISKVPTKAHLPAV